MSTLLAWYKFKILRLGFHLFAPGASDQGYLQLEQDKMGVDIAPRIKLLCNFHGIIMRKFCTSVVNYCVCISVKLNILGYFHGDPENV